MKSVSIPVYMESSATILRDACDCSVKSHDASSSNMRSDGCLRMLYVDSSDGHS
jgi:hypothetical protein